MTKPLTIKDLAKLGIEFHWLDQKPQTKVLDKEYQEDFLEHQRNKEWIDQ